jgi:T4 bacteriophage base plate protein
MDNNNKESFRQQPRKPIAPPPNEAMPSDAELVKSMQPPPDVTIEGNVPAAFKEALARRAKEVTGQPPSPQPSISAPLSNNGPRLAFTGDGRLDELLASIKDTVNRYETITLPSRGKFYDEQKAPGNGILHVRPMTGEEEQILATPRFIKKGQAINMIFRNCVNENIDPDSLLVTDRTYLLIYLRGISYSPDYEVEVKCPSCPSRFSTTIDLDTLRVNYCSEDFGPENLTDVLPTSKFKFSYRLATSQDDTKITQHRDRRIKMFGDQAADDTWIYRTSLLINEIEGITDQMSLQSLISRLPINDVAYLRNAVNDPPFGVETRVGIICPSCMEEFEVEMPMEANFFFPKRKKEKPTRV